MQGACAELFPLRSTVITAGPTLHLYRGAQNQVEWGSVQPDLVGAHSPQQEVESQGCLRFLPA